MAPSNRLTPAKAASVQEIPLQVALPMLLPFNDTAVSCAISNGPYMRMVRSPVESAPGSDRLKSMGAPPPKPAPTTNEEKIQRSIPSAPLAGCQ